jgi:hypothetical protein
MKNSTLLFALLFFSAVAHANDKPWQLKKQQDGISVSQQMTDSGYPITRGLMEVDSPVDALITVIRDNSICPRWLFSCRQSNLVKQMTPSTRLDYAVIDSPFLYADRDLYTFTEFSYDSATQTALIRMSGRETHDKGQPNRVRIKDLQGYWSMKKISASKTALTYQMYSNPQLMASGFLNNHLVDSVFHTLKNLAAVSKEAKYKNAKIDYPKEK